jgi:hypothetical protein
LLVSGEIRRPHKALAYLAVCVLQTRQVLLQLRGICNIGFEPATLRCFLRQGGPGFRQRALPEKIDGRQDDYKD